MKSREFYLLAALVATVAGCSARAEERKSPTDDPADVRIDREAIHALLSGNRQVWVVGTSKVAVVPDLAEISLGVTIARPTAAEAVSANNREMARLIEALKKRGVAPKDIQTSQISITPQYSRPAEAKPDVPPEATAPKVVGYEVSNMVRVTTRDQAGLGDLLGAATEAGSNQLYGLSFRVEDREAKVADLREKAFDDAKKKAEVYARRAGMVLGPVLQISESDGGWSPAPSSPMNFGVAVSPAPVASPMPVAPGEQEVSLSVSVSFELKLAR